MAQQYNTIKDQIIAFYNDALFQKLNAYFSKTTLFNILKIERNENRHSAFLAWLLDIKGSHGLGEDPFRRFMRLLSKQDDKYNNPFLYGNYQITNMEVKTERPAIIKNCKTRYVDVDIEFGFTVNKDKPVFAHIILENKVYTEEHDKQTDFYRKWAFEEIKKSNKKKQIIGVFLSPEPTEKCDGDTDGFVYVKITYGDVLKYVIEPLLAQEMPDETKMIISDYIVNLGQPVREKHEEEGKAKMKEDTILAMSNENIDCFLNLYQNYSNLLDTSLFSFSVEPKKTKFLKDLFEDRFDEMEKCYSTNVNLLNGFWMVNERLLRMILDTGLNRMYEDKSEEITKVLEIKSSNRDNAKYLVYAKGSKDPISKKLSPKSLASLYIFQAWLKNTGKEATLDGIRNAFPVEKFTNSEKYPYKYLFYRKKDIESALKNDKVEGKTYFRTRLGGDDKEGNKYLTWDFFVDNNEQHCLIIQGEEVLSIKMWLKEEFDALSSFAKENYGIVVEEKK